MAPNEDSLRRGDDAEQDEWAVHRGRVSTTRYENISALDHARQHIGDQYYGPVTFQNIAATRGTQDDFEEKERKAREAEQEREERTRRIDSLDFDQMDLRFVDVSPHLDGTCDWLMETRTYQQWQDPEFKPTHHGIFWIKGHAGTGKSTLMKYATEVATKEATANDHTLRFFFNARGKPMEVSPTGLFRSLLHQILKKIGGLYNLLDRSLFELAERQGWTFALLRETFRDAIMHLEKDRVTCYIDAMDECCDADVEEVIRYLDDLGDSAFSHGKEFYVCLSSRHYPNIKIGKSVQLVLESHRGHQNDVRNFIRKRLFIDDEVLKKELTEVIEQKASGVFLWVVLVIALLNGDDRRGEAHAMHKRLSEIPAELSKLFDELLKRGTPSIYLRPILRLVTFGPPRMRAKELYNAVLPEVQTVRAYYDPLTGQGDDELVTENTMAKFILESSKGLVETRQNSEVQFIHETVRTYFLNEGIRNLIEHHDSATGSSSTDGMPSLSTDTVRMATANCYERLKHCCFEYLMTIWRQLSLHTLIADKSPQKLRFLRPQIIWSSHFFEKAARNLFKYAELAHINGIHQQEFLDSLPLWKLGIFQILSNPIYVPGPAPSGPAPWYTARLLAANKCSELLMVVLETLPSNEAAYSEWSATIAIGLKTEHVETIRTILQHCTDSDVGSGWRYLRTALEGEHRDLTGRRLSVVRASGLRLQRACEERDLETIKQIMEQPRVRFQAIDS
jgi:hypothetical protein